MLTLSPKTALVSLAVMYPFFCNSNAIAQTGKTLSDYLSQGYEIKSITTEKSIDFVWIQKKNELVRCRTSAGFDFEKGKLTIYNHECLSFQN